MVITAVDSNKSDLKLLVKLLRTNYPTSKIVMFSDPIAAAQYLSETPVDVLFTAAAMPGMSGFRLKELTEEVQPGLMTVFVSVTDEYALEAMKKRALDYIVKPVTAQAVLSCLYETKFDFRQK